MTISVAYQVDVNFWIIGFLNRAGRMVDPGLYRMAKREPLGIGATRGQCQTGVGGLAIDILAEQAASVRKTKGGSCEAHVLP